MADCGPKCDDAPVIRMGWSTPSANKCRDRASVLGLNPAATSSGWVTRYQPSWSAIIFTAGCDARWKPVSRVAAENCGLATVSRMWLTAIGAELESDKSASVFAGKTPLLEKREKWGTPAAIF